MAILNVQQYLNQNGNCPQRTRETSKALKLHRNQQSSEASQKLAK